ncbi:MAG: oligosaccharide flippase family protein [Rhodobacteraceae bacterium]|nr:oligosaccharide flippase family protein [Paracoccaceae bacterium]
MRDDNPPEPPAGAGPDAAVAGRLRRLLSGSSLTARVLRSSALTVTSFGVSQGLRLLSNLVLTRLLFPEAFGLMGLVTVFMIGLMMFSDLGISQAIAQSRRGDEPDFLNTAWTLQILRGIMLFAAGCAIAWPVSAFYGEPVLFGMLLIASTQFLVSSVMPTRRETANRHLMIGRVTILEIVAQAIGLVIMVALAFWLRSVWALVIGSVINVIVQVVVISLFLPGPQNRLRLEREAALELVHFGKWIFFSTICGFLLTQGDKLILGKFLPLDAFGIYNIGYFLGSFPMMLGTTAIVRLLIPIYRERPPAASRQNFLALRRMRVAVTAGLMLMIAVVALIGVWLVDLLYDARYHDAGAVVVLVACTQIPVIIGLTYDHAALAAGDSRRFFFVTAIRAALMLTGLFLGVQAGGLTGALLGQGLAVLAAYPALVWLSSRVGAWDPVHDFGFALVGILVTAGAIWWNWEAIARLAA